MRADGLLPTPAGGDVIGREGPDRARLQAFDHTLAAINGSLEPSEVIGNAVRALLEVTGLGSGVVYWLDRKQGLLVGRAATGFRNGLRPGIDVHEKSSGSFPSRAFRASEPLIFDADDARTGYASVTERERKCIVPEDIKTAVAVRIGGGATPFGVLALCSHGSRRTFDDAAREFFLMAANQVAIALERAQIHEEVHRRSVDLAHLYEFGRRLDEFDGGPALSHALEFARSSFDFRSCEVELFPQGQSPSQCLNEQDLSAGRLALPLVGPDRLGTLLIDCGDEPSTRDQGVARALAELLSMAAWRHKRYTDSKHIGAGEERRRLARELHDGIAQRFYSIQLNLSAATDCPDESRDRGERIHLALWNSEQGVAESRAWVQELRSSVGVRYPLDEQVRSLVDEFRANFKVACVLHVAGAVQPLSQPTQAIVARCVQELLHNVGKHSSASTVHVTVAFDATGLRVAIVDDGRGLVRSSAGGFGLLGIRERMAEVGGTFRITGRPGRGTRALLTVPLIEGVRRWSSRDVVATAVASSSRPDTTSPPAASVIAVNQRHHCEH